MPAVAGTAAGSTASTTTGTSGSTSGVSLSGTVGNGGKKGKGVRPKIVWHKRQGALPGYDVPASDCKGQSPCQVVNLHNRSAVQKHTHTRGVLGLLPVGFFHSQLLLTLRVAPSLLLVLLLCCKQVCKRFEKVQKQCKKIKSCKAIEWHPKQQCGVLKTVNTGLAFLVTDEPATVVYSKAE